MGISAISSNSVLSQLLASSSQKMNTAKLGPADIGSNEGSKSSAVTKTQSSPGAGGAKGGGHSGSKQKVDYAQASLAELEQLAAQGDTQAQTEIANRLAANSQSPNIPMSGGFSFEA